MATTKKSTVQKSGTDAKNQGSVKKTSASAMKNQSSSAKNRSADMNASAKSSGSGMNAGTGAAQKNAAEARAEFARDAVSLDDKAIISDVLSSQKSLVKLYGTALCEVSCPKLRTLVNSQMAECAQDQFDAFLYMNQRNMYPTDPAPAAKVNQAKQKFGQQKSEMKK
ncbi:MAG: spore coat protein [Clostridiales bacterium]|jgi:hypothetical protein|nr:spore coat protein [Clostridiales bacterium]